MDKADKSLKTVVKGAIIFLIGMFFSKLFNYFFRLLTARLGPESYGIITLAASFVAVLATLSTLGLNNGVIRYAPYYHSRNENKKVKGAINFSLKTSLITGIIVGAIIFIFSGFISKTFFPNFNQTTLPLALKIVAMIIPPTAALFILFASFEAFRVLKYELYTKNIFEGAFKLAFTALAIYLGYTIIGAMAVYLAAVVGSMILAFYYFRKHILPIIKTGTKPEKVNKELMQYSLPLLLSGMCMILLLSVDTWLIGYYRTATEVGIYNAAMPTAQMLYTLPTILLILFLPVLTELYAKGDKEEFKTVYKSTTKWIFLVNIPLLAIFLIFPKELINMLFGASYMSGTTTFMILSAGFFTASIFMTSERMLMAVNKTKFILGGYATILILNTTLNLHLIPKYGINGAAIASASSYILLSIIFLTGSYKSTKTIPFTKDYAKSIAAALTASLAALLIKNLLQGKYTFLVLVACFILAYGIMLISLKAFDKEDKMIINSIKNKFISHIIK